MIGGRIACAIDPRIAARLSAGMRVALVTGTNGKSTTTKMLHAALSTWHSVPRDLSKHSSSRHSAPSGCAWNSGGDNMLSGITSALLNAPHATLASLEVDEMYIKKVADLVDPAAFVLLNLSRDQLDRVGEIATVERRIRTTLAEHPDALVIANCDDPLIASAAWDCENVVWVSAGMSWRLDATTFPRTGTRVRFDKDGTWSVDATYQRPTPTWQYDDSTGELLSPEGRFPLQLSLPGQFNYGNAVQAIACASSMGAPILQAIKGVQKITEVAGRYAQYSIRGRNVRLFLAKNPAGWHEALGTLHIHASRIILAVNGQEADSQDLSWIWDVDFESLSHKLDMRASASAPESASAPSRIIASGQRAADLAVRLRYADIPCQMIHDPWEAIMQSAPGDIEILANYTAFRDLKARIHREGYAPANTHEHRSKNE